MSRIEAGQILRMPVGIVLTVCTALEISLDLSPRWKGEALDRLLDAAHAELVNTLVARYRAAGWEVAVEVSFAIGGERGSVDVMAFMSKVGLVSINEVKSTVPDAQSMIHSLDRKTRLALAIARERGWAASRVARFLVIGESRTSRRRVDQLSALFETAYPLRGRVAAAWIDNPVGGLASESMAGQMPRLVSGLFFLSSVHAVNGKSLVGSRHRIRRRRAA